MSVDCLPEQSDALAPFWIVKNEQFLFKHVMFYRIFVHSVGPR